MTQEKGRNLPLSLPRRFVNDILHSSRNIPFLATMERQMGLARVYAARQAVDPRPSWGAIFLKAYGLVAARWPQLRQTYLSWPWPHLYEHPGNVAAMTFERSYQGEQGVFASLMRRPESKSLRDLDTWIRSRQHDDLEKISSFRRILWLSRLPWPLRRLLWWLGLKWTGSLRARFWGTFCLTATAGRGASLYQVLSPLTTAVHYGVFDNQKNLPFRLVFDHRVLDGANVARVLQEVEEVLNHNILEELRWLAGSLSGVRKAS